MNPAAVDGVVLEPVFVALDELCAPRRSWELVVIYTSDQFTDSPRKEASEAAPLTCTELGSVTADLEPRTRGHSCRCISGRIALTQGAPGGLLQAFRLPLC